MSIEYVELTITDSEPIQITISDIPEAASGGGLSPIAAQTLLGNNTGSTALPTGLTAEQARTLLSVYSTSQVDTILGGYAVASDLATVATSGSFIDLDDVPNFVVEGDARLSDARTPTSHPHGNITNAGAIGSTADLILGTGTAGAIETRTASQVRTLLGLATTDTPQFSGVQLGTSGFLVGGTNLIEQRNGTNGQIARWAKTWTSATNLEAIELDCAGNATTFDLAVCSGSAGGSNRGLRFGSKFAGGAFSSWLSFATTGSATINGADQVLTLSSSTVFALVRCAQSAAPTQFMEFGRAGSRFIVACQGNIPLEFETNNTRRFVIGGAGDSEFLSDLTIRPSSSRTLTVNGQFTIEMTSNTAGNLVYRGSDGTTRRMALTFS
jgi:hypothetical protein